MAPAVGFDVQGSYAYILSGRYGNSDMKIVDISNPTNPYVIGSWSCLGLVWICDPDQMGADALWSIEVSDDFAYIRGWNGVYIVDVSEQSNPELASYVFPDLTYPVWLHQYGNKLYTQSADSDGTQRVIEIDVTDPENPSTAVWSTLIDYSAWDMRLHNNLHYVVADGIPGELRIYDSSPSELSLLTLDSFSYGLDVVDDYAYVGDINAVYAVDTSAPNMPLITDTYGDVGFVVDIHIDNNVAYVSQKYGSLVALSIADRNQLTHLATYPLSPDASVSHQSRTQNGYVYTTDRDKFYILAHVPATTTITDISMINEDSYAVHWEHITYAHTAYELEERYSGGSWVNVYTGDSAVYEASNQVDGMWCYRIRLVNGAVYGGWSDEQCIVVESSPPTGDIVVYLPFIIIPDVNISVSSVLVPFDANQNDLSGPSRWSTNYGKTPEIIVSSNGVELDILAQDYDSDTVWQAVLLHVEPDSTGGYKITQALTALPMLDRVMGLASDGTGNRYYATGVDESDVVDSTYPPLNTYRNDIVRVVKLNSVGAVQFNIDLDTARHTYNSNAEMIINPMTAATSRLAVGGNEIALVHGINTDPDWNIGGARHQKALSTRLDATSGDVTRTSSVWVSHSFDQRLLYDGEGIIEHHLGDAFPRYIVFAREHSSYPLFHIKGDLGENNTRTRLGNISLIENDPVYRYIALFATENSADTGGCNQWATQFSCCTSQWQ